MMAFPGCGVDGHGSNDSTCLISEFLDRKLNCFYL
jgi:hypothetical protein